MKFARFHITVIREFYTLDIKRAGKEWLIQYIFDDKSENVGLLLLFLNIELKRPYW